LPLLPAAFVGELPCADCPGVEHQVELFEDGSYFHRQTFVDREHRFDDVGAWSFDGETGVLRLAGELGSPTFFELGPPDRLRLLDREARRIESELNYELRLSVDAVTLEPKLSLTGLFRYMADAALFEHCASGARWPVAMEGDYLALERAYLAARTEPGGPLPVRVEGRIASRPPMEGDGTRPTVVVEQFVEISPADGCAEGRARP
jgi:copper homeostasis protein (lipoprotein)